MRDHDAVVASRAQQALHDQRRPAFPLVAITENHADPGREDHAQQGERRRS